MERKVRKVWVQGDLFFNAKAFKKEKGGGPRITEQAGYVPVQIQVRNMIAAGERLGEYRKEQFDYAAGETVPDDVEVDITRSPNFDLADGTQLGRAAISRLKEDAKAKKEKADVEIPREPEEKA